ncbi:diguanylate cyclase [Gracilibacillus oryzae]|uniref:Diguanylate cyclase n=1 Tax=Gracilibacillus oryzae TaxID=1672701 RepID=A0A7C8GTA8_9BACI|nr:histidine kinase N-terminal 7TM domain-containing protein [Gracilibacillus oryzae]KAB8136756.1 diguanylate cyclase [Gracilibacillus oryzae]
MTSELTATIALICTSAVLNLYLCFLVYRKRHLYSNIADFFIGYAMTITIYCFAAAFSLLAESMVEVKIWTTIQYIGIAFSPPLGLLFTLKYLGTKLTPGIYFSLLIIPVLSLMMVATKDFHHAHYRVFQQDPSLGLPYLYLEIGPWYVVHGTFTFACMFFAFSFLLIRWKDTAQIYRPQLVALLLGQFIPMLTAFIYLIGLTPPGIDPVPIVLWITSVLYLWAINSSRLFTILPVAKDAIFNSMNDGVIVLDESNRLIEFNQAYKRMFPQINKKMTGKDIEKVWKDLTEEPLLKNMETNVVTEITINHSIYQVSFSRLRKASGSLIIFTDITKLKTLQMKLEHQAYYDELTQTLNRRAFFEKGEQAYSGAIIHDVPFIVMLMDVDFFKKVNDTHGHDIGDKALQHVASTCKSMLDEEMIFARYGGEEFVLSVSGYSLEKGEKLADQLRMKLESSPLVTENLTITITVSIGMAIANTDTLEQLLIKADKALYTAKRNGRNQVSTFERVEII